MNVMESLKNFFMPADEEEETETPATTTKGAHEASTSSSAETTSYTRPSSTYTSGNNYANASYDDSASSTSSRSSNSNKTERYTTINAKAQFQVVLVKATTYTGDSKKVADYLMQGRTVVLNLEDIDDTNKRRIVDFVVGAAYAMHGKIRPIASETFLIIPQNVGFDGDEIVGELKGSGLV